MSPPILPRPDLAPIIGIPGDSSLLDRLLSVYSVDLVAIRRGEVMCKNLSIFLYLS